jgi:hypothetical protein
MKHSSALIASVLLATATLQSIGTSSCRAVELAHYAFDQVDTIPGSPGPPIVPDTYTTPDSSGRNNTANLTAMTPANLVPGRVGNALQFNGGSSAATRNRVEVPTPAPNPDPILTDFNRTYTQFTFAALVRPSGILETDTDIAFIAGKLGNSPNRGWQIGWQGNTATHPHELVVSIFDGPLGTDHTDEIYSGPTTDLANDKWAHVAITYSALSEAEPFIRMYINGLKVSEITATSDIPMTTNLLNGINLRNFQIGNGNRGDQRADSWTGLIDEVHIYDHALTDAQIAALVPPPLPIGDFNGNGVVDAADYVVWRKNLDGVTALGLRLGLPTTICGNPTSVPQAARAAELRSVLLCQSLLPC